MYHANIMGKQVFKRSLTVFVIPPPKKKHKQKTNKQKQNKTKQNKTKQTNTQ